jgi:hypothetical protein
MMIIGLYPPEASSDQLAKVAFYLLLDPAHAQMQALTTTSNTM